MEVDSSPAQSRGSYFTLGHSSLCSASSGQLLEERAAPILESTGRILTYFSLGHSSLCSASSGQLRLPLQLSIAIAYTLVRFSS